MLDADERGPCWGSSSCAGCPKDRTNNSSLLLAHVMANRQHPGVGIFTNEGPGPSGSVTENVSPVASSVASMCKGPEPARATHRILLECHGLVIMNGVQRQPTPFVPSLARSLDSAEQASLVHALRHEAHALLNGDSSPLDVPMLLRRRSGASLQGLAAEKIELELFYVRLKGRQR